MLKREPNLSIEIDLSSVYKGMRRLQSELLTSSAKAMAMAGEDEYVPIMRLRLSSMKNAGVLDGDKKWPQRVTDRLHDSLGGRVESVGFSEASATIGPHGISYAMEIETGRAPYKPSIETIARWIINKPTFQINDMKVARKVAGAIVKKLSEVGHNPYPFMEPAFEMGSDKTFATYVRYMRHGI